jgi:hypothetical protein
LISATNERSGGAFVIARQSIQRAPCHGIPARFIRSVTFDGFMNEARCDKFTFCASDYVHAVPSTLREVSSGREQSAVVVAHELPIDLDQE